MASLIYNNAKMLIGNGTLNWTSGTYRIALVTSTYTPDIDNHVYVSSITNELTGGNYVRKDTTNRTITVDSANDRADYKADNITWTAINAGTVGAAILYKFNTNDADSQLIAYIDLTDTVTNGGDFTIKWEGQASNGRIFSIA